MSKTPSFIKLERSLFNTTIWSERRKFSRFEAWLDLCRRASFSDGKYIGKGELRATHRQLAAAWGWDKRQVTRFLKALTDAGCITKNSLKTSVLQIVPNSYPNIVPNFDPTQLTDYQQESNGGVPKNVPNIVPNSYPNFDPKPPIIYNKKERSKEEQDLEKYGISVAVWVAFRRWTQANTPKIHPRITPSMFDIMLVRTFRKTNIIARILAEVERETDSPDSDGIMKAFSDKADQTDIKPNSWH